MGMLFVLQNCEFRGHSQIKPKNVVSKTYEGSIEKRSLPSDGWQRKPEAAIAFNNARREREK